MSAPQRGSAARRGLPGRVPDASARGPAAVLADPLAKQFASTALLLVAGWGRRPARSTAGIALTHPTAQHRFGLRSASSPFPGRPSQLPGRGTTVRHEAERRRRRAASPHLSESPSPRRACFTSTTQSVATLHSPPARGVSVRCPTQGAPRSRHAGNFPPPPGPPPAPAPAGPRSRARRARPVAVASQPDRPPRPSPRAACPIVPAHCPRSTGFESAPAGMKPGSKALCALASICTMFPPLLKICERATGRQRLPEARD